MYYSKFQIVQKKAAHFFSKKIFSTYISKNIKISIHINVPYTYQLTPDLSVICILSYSYTFLSATELKFRADYNSTPCGVGVVVVVVVGVRVHFKNGITFERFEISAWFLVYILVMLIHCTARNFFEIGWCEPAQPAYQPKFYEMG